MRVYPHTPQRTHLVRTGTRVGVVKSRRSVVVYAKDEKESQRQPWDFGRFVKTVAFFNPLPKPEELVSALIEQPAKLFSSLLEGKTQNAPKESSAVLTMSAAARPEDSASSNVEGVVLVTGATGGVGKRVVQQLLAQGLQVRALARDVEKARTLLGALPVGPGGSLQVAAGDLTQRATLLPEFFEGVRAVVNASAVKVAPKEGDTEDRQKYSQGIKFYDPEIVGDTPETVEYVGMRNLLDAVRPRLGACEGLPLLGAGASGVQWGALDDVVMGGVSSSALERRPRAAQDGRQDSFVFRGVVSTDNSGGFCSVRSRNIAPLLDASPYEGLALRLRGDGQRYKLILRTDTSWDGIGYCQSFDTLAGQWHTVRLPFSGFRPTFRARTLPDGPPLDPSRLASVQLMLSKFEYDGQLNPSFRPGVFELVIEEIRASMPEPLAPRFVHVSSAGVTRPGRPGLDPSTEPPAVGLNDALGGLLTWKLAGEDALRVSGVPAAVVRPCALTEEPAGAPLLLDQGDTIKGKISREDVAELCVALLSAPAALGTTFEVKCTLPFSQPWEAAADAPPRDWAALLVGAKLVPGVTGKTVGGVYTGKQPEAVAAAQVVAA